MVRMPLRQSTINSPAIISILLFRFRIDHDSHWTIIHQLNQMPIDTMETLRASVAKLKAGDPVVLQVEREDGLMYVSFEME